MKYYKEKLKNLKQWLVKKKKKSLNGPLTKVEKQRIAVIFIIAFFAIFFWSAFEQAGVSLTYFTTIEVNRALTTSLLFLQNGSNLVILSLL